MRDPDQEYLNEENRPSLVFRDLTLKEEVGEALAFHEDIDASEIEVDARDGVVTLYGSVRTPREKEEATNCASDVEGVITVMNFLEVN